MFIGTVSLILIMSKLKPMEALTEKKMQATDPLSDDRVVLTPEDVFRIKSFLLSLDHVKDGPMKDPGSYCRSFDNCYECVKSIWFPCGWCHKFGCTDSPEVLCPNAETEAEKSNITGEIKACPHIEHEGPILVPEGVSTKIKVKVYAPDPAILDQAIVCQIKIGKRLTHLKGVIRNGFVHCYPVVLQSYAKLYGDKDRGSLTLVWGGAQPYSNEIPLVVYNCEVLVSNCEDCTKIPAEFGCGWCDTIMKCVMKEECAHSRLTWIRDWGACSVNGKKLFKFLCIKL